MKETTEGVRPVVLMVLDGWGVAAPGPGNAVNEANTPHIRRLSEKFLCTTVAAHGRAVGLMPEQMGDSNVGHLTIGAGRIIRQNLVRIHDAIAEGELAKSPGLQKFLGQTQGKRLHLMGLLSPGGVHSHQDHLKALLEIVAASPTPPEEVLLHLWLDGRDVAPKSAIASLEWLATTVNRLGVGTVATVAGRYYAMDRDNRWDRTEKSYRAMVQGQGQVASSAVEVLVQAYQDGISDEFVVPSVIVDAYAKPVGTIGPEDSVLVFNFRADRVRQITRALMDPDFAHFERPWPRIANFLGMTQYDESFVLPHLFPPESVANNLAEWLSQHKQHQLHLAETEKYAHVTFFFNGGVEKVYPGEDRIMIPSPQVATYDQEPQMSAEKIKNAVIEGLDQKAYDFILLNFANSDMVGHTGDLAATKTAIGVVDQMIGEISDAVLKHEGALVIVADHGNAEVMQDAGGDPNTNHTTNPVPLIVVAADAVLEHRTLASGGGLKDVSPTVLDLMGMPIPSEMQGQSLLRQDR